LGSLNEISAVGLYDIRDLEGSLLELYVFVTNQCCNLEPLLDLLNDVRDRVTVARSEEDDYGSTTLAHLVANSRGPHALTLLRMLHQLHPDLAFIESDCYTLPLHHAAMHTDDEQVLRFLLELNPTPVLPPFPKHYSNPLSWLIGSRMSTKIPGNLQCLKLMLEVEGSNAMVRHQTTSNET
jgi:hypothetical protein